MGRSSARVALTSHTGGHIELLAVDDARPSRQGPTGHLQRVPPHDTQTEKNLLGAALLNKDAAAVLARLSAGDFYTNAHVTIAGAICDLVDEETAVDPGTVSALLRSRGQLDGINIEGHHGGSYLVHLQSVCPSTGSAPAYATWVERYASQRRVLSLAHAVAESIYMGTAIEGLVAEMVSATEAGIIGVESTWDLVNLAATLAGQDGDEHPIYLERTDGVPLLYPGKVHAFNAESETGKSMLAIYCCAERLLLGEHVGYIDFEDSARGVIDRLLGFGVAPAVALERFHYVRPDDPIDGGAKLRVREMLKVFPMTLVVIDGVAEALSLSGWDENTASDIAAFYNTLPRVISREGATVILIDHLVKDKEKQGNDARGSGAKRAGIDGAAFKLETIKPFVRGGQGVAKVVLTKDRPGWVRPSAAGRSIAEMHLSSNVDTGAITCELRPPTSSTDGDGHFRPTVLMERVSILLEASTVGVTQRWVEREAKGTASHVRTALAVLVEEGYVEVEEGGGRAKLHTSVRPFRQTAPEPEGSIDGPWFEPDEEF